MGLASPKICVDATNLLAVLQPVGPQSVTWRMHREVILLLGWGRAILLQFAHPLVAQGVAEHSVFLAQPAARLQRLRSTIDSMLALTFGDASEVAEAAGRINAIHDRVHGELGSSSERFAQGTLYSARDADLLRWVHATLLDSFILTYERCVRLLGAAEKDAYCFESSGVEALLGIPPGYLPRSSSELHGYMRQMLASGEIEVTDTARLLARAVLYPNLPRPAEPLLWLMRLFTVGTLPPAARIAYGFSWSARQEKTLRLLTALIRLLLPVLPPVLRYWKKYRLAIQRA